MIRFRPSSDAGHFLYCRPKSLFDNRTSKLVILFLSNDFSQMNAIMPNYFIHNL